MGLDMYLNGSKYHFTDWNNPKNNLSEDGFLLKEKILELGYWRKHPNLHGYIVKEFAGGQDECQDIQLEEEDILKIIEAIKTKLLPNTTGFFFGESPDHNSPNPNEREDAISQDKKDIETFEKAIAWLKSSNENESRSVFYRASW